MDSTFRSRRSPVVGSRWGVSCDQPLASKIGADVLTSGGNAADAAVAACAALCVAQPSSVSLGGDAFCLFYDANHRSVSGYNGSGRSPAGLTLDYVQQCGFDEDHPIPVDSPLSVTVPGLPAALEDIVKGYGSGKFSLSDLLQPSIELAETGFAVSPIASVFWCEAEASLRRSQNGRELLLPDGRAPRTGQIVRLPCMANSLRVLAEGGKEAFYKGRFATDMAESIRQQGGVVTEDDLRQHLESPPEHVVQPLSVAYKGRRVWQLPPNSDGFVALLALNIMEGLDLKGLGHNSASYLYHLVESLRLSFADGFFYNSGSPPPEMQHLLSKEYADQRTKLISDTKCLPADVGAGAPRTGPGETVYVSVVDGEGNGCSLMTTCCGGFGSTLVPRGCGFCMQNRVVSFSLKPSSRNILGPSKRTFHTNMPGMITDQATGLLLASVGVMGYLAQPQGLVQVLLNMMEFGMDPQEALEQCRICLMPVFSPKIDAPFPIVALEDGLGEEVLDELADRGYPNLQMHTTVRERASFGRGQVVTCNGAWWRGQEEPNGGSVWVGSDPRGDGQGLAR